MAEVGDHVVRVNEGIRVQEHSLCRLCSSQGVSLHQGLKDRLLGVPGVWTLLRCPNCGLVWLNPRPVPEDMGKLYTEYYTHAVSEPVPRRLERLRKAVKRGILASAFGYDGLAKDGVEKSLGWLWARVGLLRDIAGGAVMWLHGSGRGRILDVGCGKGEFLANMRNLGWEVVGVEPDPKAVNLARKQYDLDTYQGTLEEAGFPEESFDVITMNHVIEHLPDPISTLRECHRVLRPGGSLVAVTPNIRSLGFRLFGQAWRGLEPPRHLYLFSTETLRTAAESTGFRGLELRTTSRTARWMWIASQLIRRDGMLPGRLPEGKGLGLQLEGLAFLALEYALNLIIDAGEELVLIASK